MQAWWAEETSIKYIKNQKLLTGSVYTYTHMSCDYNFYMLDTGTLTTKATLSIVFK